MLFEEKSNIEFTHAVQHHNYIKLSPDSFEQLLGTFFILFLIKNSSMTSRRPPFLKNGRLYFFKFTFFRKPDVLALF